MKLLLFLLAFLAFLGLVSGQGACEAGGSGEGGGEKNPSGKGNSSGSNMNGVSPPGRQKRLCCAVLAFVGKRRFSHHAL